MACDLRIAAPDAEFAITPAKLGISYPQEDVHRLVALVGPGQAARLLLGAQSISGEEARRIGLVEAAPCRTDEALIEAILANAPDSLAALKQAIAPRRGGRAQRCRDGPALRRPDRRRGAGAAARSAAAEMIEEGG